MTDTDKLDPGWYWVRWTVIGGAINWTVAYLDRALRWWSFEGDDDDIPPAIIGPRLTPPGEG